MHPTMNTSLVSSKIGTCKFEVMFWEGRGRVSHMCNALKAVGGHVLNTSCWTAHLQARGLCASATVGSICNMMCFSGHQKDYKGWLCNVPGVIIFHLAQQTNERPCPLPPSSRGSPRLNPLGACSSCTQQPLSEMQKLGPARKTL